jgi:hypothetical protein
VGVGDVSNTLHCNISYTTTPTIYLGQQKTRERLMGLPIKNFPEEILIAHRINRNKKITAVVFFPLLYQERNKLRLLHLLG